MTTFAFRYAYNSDMDGPLLQINVSQDHWCQIAKSSATYIDQKFSYNYLQSEGTSFGDW